MNRVAKLTIRNFLGIENLEFSPGAVTVISGRNGEGKTSILKAIQAVLGAQGKPVDLIRLGADSAEVALDLGDNMRVSRRLTTSGNYVDVIENGVKKPQAQTFLKALIGDGLAFNPLEFFAAKPAERRRLLLSAIPMSVTPEQLEEWFGAELAAGTSCDAHALEVIAGIERKLYDTRAEANAAAKAAAARVSTHEQEVPANFTSERAEAIRSASVSELHSAIAAGQKQRDAVEQISRDMAAQRHEMEKITIKRNSLLEQIGVLDGLEHDMKQKLHANAVEMAGFDIPDTSAAEQALAQHDADKAALATWDNLSDARNELRAASDTAEFWTERLTVARALPEKLLAEADVPIEGLAITADDITVNGVAIDNLSESERLLLSIDVVRALQPALPILCVDGLEKLDPPRRAEFLAEIEKSGMQAFVTEVTDGDMQIETSPQEAQDVSAAAAS